jgi:16S rRNA (guanine966-N2)-methyltransferase
MRIVAGAYRGRSLVAPKGHSTRPTADRARQGLFNVLEHAPWGRGLGGARVIDLFAGSGALGIEALSRGAAFCVFVERDGAARAAIAANLAALACAERGRILGLDARALGPRPELEAPFDLALLDPPYGADLGEAALAALAAGGWLAQDAVVTMERAAADKAPAAPAFSHLDQRAWGAARVDFLRYDGRG